jgi:hypothetical protein
MNHAVMQWVPVKHNGEKRILAEELHMWSFSSTPDIPVNKRRGLSETTVFVSNHNTLMTTYSHDGARRCVDLAVLWR